MELKDLPEFKEVKDSGAREQFASGAVRDTQDGKPRPDRALRWLPLEALERVSTHYENGAKKYDRDNWRKGIPASRCLTSAFRHLFQWMMGDRGEDHLSAVVFNVFCIITWEQLGRTDMLDTATPVAIGGQGLCRGCKRELANKEGRCVLTNTNGWCEDCISRARSEQPTECKLNRRGFYPTRRLRSSGQRARRIGWGRRSGDFILHCPGAV